MGRLLGSRLGLVVGAGVLVLCLLASALLGSLTTAALILDGGTLDEIRFWLAGSVAGRDLDLLLQVLPYLGFGLLLAFALGRQITAPTLGEDVAGGLGQLTAWVKALAVAAVVLLAGGVVALAGPIGFVGLVVPHVARFSVGVDYRWILPYSALLGAVLLVAADIAARLVLRPQELPVGIMTAFVGAPFSVDAEIFPDPPTGGPLCIPYGLRHADHASPTGKPA